LKILVTGAAGFIGSHLSKKLIKGGNKVLGIDNFNTYYDVDLKYARLNKLVNHKNFICKNIDLCDKPQLEEIFKNNNFDIVVNLAAQAGVRYSIKNPQSYLDSNLIGFMNILEAVRNYKIPHLIYASSSSVYGNSDNIPYSESQNINKPISLYAATKISNEAMAFSYSHLYNFSTTGLRFFTVYGPWGRPDMAYYLFTKNILENKPINVFADGLLKRDFTYIDDIIDGMTLILNKTINKKRSEIFNIGNNKPIVVNDFIKTIEKSLNKKAKINFLPMQNGDVQQTYADLSKISKYVNFQPKTDIETGILKFCDWYKDFYNIS
tara:strand:- start:1310 stop:2275 length:966 start_codon:yes stop_codon:yes gene_type:complete